jgi:hypothetical protein
MTRSKPAKTDVVGVRIDADTKETIAAIGKTPTEMINSGLQHQIRSHTHVLLETIFKTKLEQGWLPHPTWKYLSDQIHEAFESISFTRSRFTAEQLLDVHDAFRSLLDLAISEKSNAIHYYKGNLGSHAPPDTKRSLIEAIDTAKKDIQSYGDKHPWSSRPFAGLIVRNLNVALRDEEMEQSKINKALSPYWQTIWHIVAAKHWDDFHVPINVMTKDRWVPANKDMEPLREGGVTLTVWTLADKPDLQINVSLQNLFWYPNSFPEIQELQRALSSVPKELKQQHRYITFWDGPSYQVSVQQFSDHAQIVLNIRKANLNVYFEQSEWTCLQKLLNLALSQSNIPSHVDVLKLQYGSSF